MERFFFQYGWQKVLECGAEVQLEPDAIHGTEDRAIQVLGSLEQTLAAVLALQQLIPAPDSPEVFSEEEILLEASDADSPPEKRQMSMRFAVTAAEAAWVVGRKGQSINQLRSQTQANIEVSNSGCRTVEVDGEEEQVMLAIELLLQQIFALPDGAPERVTVVLPPNSAGGLVCSEACLDALRLYHRAARGVHQGVEAP